MSEEHIYRNDEIISGHSVRGPHGDLDVTHCRFSFG